MKKLYINANCQGPACKQMLSEVLTDWRIESLPVHEPHSEDTLKSVREFISQADAIVSQPISNSYSITEFRSDSIRNLARSTALIEWFPSIYFTGQQITLCTLKHNGKRLNTPGWLYHDCIVAFLIAEGLEIEQVVEHMMDRELFSKSWVEEEVCRIVSENINREKELGCTITGSQLFANQIASRVLCHTFNHPVRFVLAHVCNSIISLIGRNENVSDKGTDFLRYPHYPMLPSVAFHLGEIYNIENFLFHWKSKSLTFDEYIRSMFRSYRNLDKDLILAALSETQGVPNLIHKFRQYPSRPISPLKS
ncbi:WcbI family polysaccharide biosynthesis putative acetyltransferase [Hyphomicrobium sp.]|uniref:WcbI family polysaccharide biosynthesis putative acetyltransferase n=1 Tax=Hyphomicrobium sp. TaxID=82 RepID=UPI0025C31FE0|nr:WcbI family polysaccharide biosynthesis putative acetyltransferase [Hyphomicrobium sp.]MCC7253461.1 hypothetical protein [Hyphomicrobium sp.]